MIAALERGIHRQTRHSPDTDRDVEPSFLVLLAEDHVAVLSPDRPQQQPGRSGEVRGGNTRDEACTTPPHGSGSDRAPAIPRVRVGEKSSSEAIRLWRRQDPHRCATRFVDPPDGSRHPARPADNHGVDAGPAQCFDIAEEPATVDAAARTPRRRARSVPGSPRSSHPTGATRRLVASPAAEAGAGDGQIARIRRATRGRRRPVALARGARRRVRRRLAPDGVRAACVRNHQRTRRRSRGRPGGSSRYVFATKAMKARPQLSYWRSSADSVSRWRWNTTARGS